MTREEWRAFKIWCGRNEALVYVYVLWVSTVAWMVPVLLATEMSALWGLSAIPLIGMPGVILGLNAAVLGIRRHTSRKLRHQQKVRELEQREARIRELEQAAL